MSAQRSDLPRSFLEALADEVPESLVQADDAELERRITSGDDLAFKALMVKHGPAVAKAISKREHIDANVDEMLQDVFMRVYLALPDKPADSPLEYWIMTIAINLATDAQRKGGRRRQDGVEVKLTGSIAQEVEVPDTLPDDEVKVRRSRKPAAILYAESESLPAAEAFLKALSSDDWRSRLGVSGSDDYAVAAAEVIEVPCGAWWERVEATMTFLAVLAYPDDHGERDRAIVAMGTPLIRAHRQAGIEVPAEVSALLKAMPAQQEANTLGRLAKRLDYRLKSAFAAMALLGQFRMPGREVAIGPAERQKLRFLLISEGKTSAQADAKTPETKREPGDYYTLNSLADLFYKSRRTFYREVWKPEVLHLAMAFRALSLRWPEGQGFGVLALLADLDWIADTLVEAERWAVLLVRASQAVPALEGVRPECQIRLPPILR